MAVSILLDNNIFSISIVTEPAKKLQKRKVGNSTQYFDISGYKVKQIPHKNNEWIKEQILCIPTITRLSVQNKVKLFTYSELEYEGWKRSGYPLLISKAKINKLIPPIERSKFQQYADLHKYISGDEFIKFIKSLLECDENKLLEIKHINEMLSSFERENICALPRLRTLCEKLDDEKLRDAFHLWTGEIYGVNNFMTMDKKFINAMTKSNKIKLTCNPITHSELLKELNIEPDPFSLKPGQFYNYFSQLIE